MIHGLVYAQDLEDDYLKISNKEALDVEEDYSDEEEALDDLLSNYQVSEKRTKIIEVGDVDLVAAKKEQLSIVIRRAYYQKLTTPRWASVLAADSWKDSFLKWRYYAQLRNYIASIDSDLTYFKMNKPIIALANVGQNKVNEEATIQEEVETTETIAIAVKEPEKEELAPIEVAAIEEPVPSEDTTEIEETLSTNAPIANVEEGPEIAEEDFTKINQALASEEAWENIAEEEKVKEEAEAIIQEEVEATETIPLAAKEKAEEKFSFSLAQLTLSDGIVSERETYELAQREQAIEDSLSNIALDEALASAEVAAALRKEAEMEERKKEQREEKAQKDRERLITEKKNRTALALAKKKKEAQKQTTTTPAVVTNNQPAKTTSYSSSPSTAGAGNRTITAASVAPSTAPKSISAGRLAQTAGFVKRKGKMSWPVMSGVVTDRFGIRANAAARGLKPRNNGVDMNCPTGTSILAVHSGTVMMVAKQAPYDHIVTVKHGDYTSAYYYINRPSVKVGDVVAMGQRVGRLIGGDGEAVFHFELWEGQNKVNPEIWLSPR